MNVYGEKQENSDPQIRGPEKATEPAAPGIFNIELTNRCPMSCVMCPRTKHMTREQGTMEFRLFKKTVDELLNANPEYIRNRVVWLHHFGESLLHPEFDRFITYAREQGLNTGLSLNPIMLDEKRSLKLLEASPHILYISLDGHDDDSFFAIRGMKDAYETSKIRLEDFLRVKNENKSPVTVILSMINFSLNEASVQDVRQYWESTRGIDGFLLKNFTTWDGNCNDINTLAEKSSNAKPKAVSDIVTCTFPFDSVTVTWNGDVVPCCFDYNSRYVLGNIGPQTLDEIWTGGPINALRKEFSSNRVRNPLCRNCEKLREPRHLWQW
ncbi:MAG TPA: SPASM domain-containing protein [Spirochaetota bacterium]|nr:SPASM domain-containing protein [Spirochaetota bacterium]HPI90279.1 SPASM domain-containing protein [Spirochaetota bacterium]HPR46383.1 SPASM domain-containing protein [Spirochaetota bacterium]